VLKNPVEYERDTSSEKFKAVCRQVSPTSLEGVSAGYYHRAGVDKSGVIRTVIGTHKGQ
jgi:hypothetical protein